MAGPRQLMAHMSRFRFTEEHMIVPTHDRRGAFQKIQHHIIIKK